MVELNTLWYENAQREKWVPPLNEGDENRPPGFIYQWSRFPCTLRTNVLLDEGGRSRSISSGSCSWSADLVLALVRPSIIERARQFLRSGHFKKCIPTMQQAILVAVTSCEACSNSLAFEHGLNWGYRRYSKKYFEAGTSCELCREGAHL